MTKEQKAQARKSVGILQAYHRVFSGPDGDRVLFDMMKKHGVLAAHPSSPQDMALKEGERAVVLRIMAYLKTSPQKLIERIENADKYDE